jgi:hypothetical protein
MMTHGPEEMFLLHGSGTTKGTVEESMFARLERHTLNALDRARSLEAYLSKESARMEVLARTLGDLEEVLRRTVEQLRAIERR